MKTVRDVCILARSILKDVPGRLYADDVLLPYINLVYGDIQSKLAENGIKNLVEDVELTLTATETELSPSSTPALPDELIVPWILWEKPAGSSERFIEMAERGPLPDFEQGQNLRVWEWLDDRIVFIGATRNITVKIRFEQEIPDLTLVGAGAEIRLRGVLSALAYGTAWHAASNSAHQSMYESELGQLINRLVRPTQRRSRRRRPFGYSSHYGNRRY